MYEITIDHPESFGGTRVYKIYLKEEADDAGIEYIDWREAGVGEWALSDDGYVSEIIRRKEYSDGRDGKNHYIQTPWGYTMWSPRYPTKKFYAEGRKCAYTLTGKRKIEQFAPKLEKLAMCYAQTMNKDISIDLAFGSLSKNQHSMWKRKMKSEVFRDMVRKELASLLSSHGMTEDYTLDLLENTIEMAKGKNDVTNLMRAVENLQGMHGMNNKEKVRTTTQLEGTITRKLLDQVHEEERKVIATQIQEAEYESHKSSSDEGADQEKVNEAPEV